MDKPAFSHRVLIKHFQIQYLGIPLLSLNVILSNSRKSFIKYAVGCNKCVRFEMRAPIF